MTVTTAKVAGVTHDHRLLAPAPGPRHPARHPLCDGPLRCRHHPQPRRRSGHRRHGQGAFRRPRPTSLSAPATSTWPRPSASSTGRSASTCSQAPPTAWSSPTPPPTPTLSPGISWVRPNTAGTRPSGWSPPTATLAEAVLALVPDLIARLPDLNASNASAAWSDCAEVMLCDSGAMKWPGRRPLRPRTPACSGRRP
jgi:sulfopropanediol 3-dehydrogenase